MSLIRFDEQTEPITPPTGKVSLYVDSLDKEVTVKKDDGSVQKFLNTVISVNTFTGNVVLTSTDVPEGTNLYYTSARFSSDLALTDTDSLTEGINNLYYTSARFSSDLALTDTDSLTEGINNLYYTDARADSRIALQKGVSNGLATLGLSGTIPSSQLPAIAITSTFVVPSESAQLALTVQEGDVAVRTDIAETFIHNGGIAGTITDWTMLLSPVDAVMSVNGFTGVVILTTTDIAEGTNLYFTQTNFDASLATKTTDDLPEGLTNFYSKWNSSGLDINFITGKVGVGTATPNTIMDIQGGQTVAVTDVNIAAYSILNTDYIINVDYTLIGTAVITLPTAQMIRGRIIEIKDSGFNAESNNITIATEGIELIENTIEAVINGNGSALTLYSNGTAWFIY